MWKQLNHLTWYALSSVLVIMGLHDFLFGVLSDDLVTQLMIAGGVTSLLGESR